MEDFLDAKRTEIGNRLNELKPLVDEYRRLEAATAALDGVPASNGTAPPVIERAAARATAPRAKTSKPRSRSAAAGRRGRPKGSGARGAQAVDLVKENPGITIPEIAEKMGIKQNYLYRVLPGLAKDGLVKKEGRGWHALEQDTPEDTPVAAA